ncbi:MAG TPA: NUDIX hydrolase [Promineifilum sp.]
MRDRSPPEFPMEPLQSRIVWEGKWRVRVDSFRLPDGRIYERGAIDHPGSVVLVALQEVADGEDPKVIMLRQHRPALNKVILELPAGTREPDESWLGCAQRELREETGYRAENFISLGEIWPAPGLSNERMALFLARGLSAAPLPMDFDEEIAVESWPLGTLAAMALGGELEDAKSVVAILRAGKYLGPSNEPRDPG